MRTITMLVVALLLANSAYASGAFSWGKKLNEMAHKTDAYVQKKLDESPRVRAGITKGLNGTAEFVSGAVNPNASNEERQMNKDAVNAILNPSRTESNKATNRLLNHFK